MSELRPALGVIVLAGGAGRRLGGRKDGLPLGGLTLLQRSLTLGARLADEVLLLPGPWALPSPPPEGVRLVADDPRVPGPLGALMGGLRASRFDACLLLPCDMPFASAAVAWRLAEQAAGGALAVVVRSPRGREPFHGVWRRGALPELEDVAARGGRSLQAALDALAARRALVEVDGEELADLDAGLSFLLNVNTADDLAVARARAGA